MEMAYECGTTDYKKGQDTLREQVPQTDPFGVRAGLVPTTKEYSNLVIVCKQSPQAVIQPYKTLYNML